MFRARFRVRRLGAVRALRRIHREASVTLKKARLSAFMATLVLTAAVFLLPANAVDTKKPVQVTFATQVEGAR